jgi:acetyl esterase
VKARDHAFRALMKLPRDALRRIAGAPVVIEGHTLDVQLQIMLDAMRRMKIETPEDVEASRRQTDEDVAAVAPDDPGMASERDVLVPGPGGSLRARVYRPRTARARPGLLVYFHGGAFVFGSISSHEPALRMLAHESGVVVASIEYRLAPEHKFPAAALDALAAYRWAREHAADLGVDPARVGVGGDSAGGNLSAVACHLAAEQQYPQPAHQLLIYPAVDWWRRGESHRTFASGFFLDESRTDWAEKHYLSRIEERDDPRASPIRSKHPRGLAPATIVTAGFDILRDEGDEYAESLRRAGIRVDHCCETSLVHGFFNMGGAIDAARAANTRIAERLRDALA